MFVRNNTTCPNCGKSKTFDLFFNEWSSPTHLTISAECSNCMWVGWAHVDVDTVRSFSLAVTKLLPLSDPLRRCWRWATSYQYGKRQLVAVSSLASDLFDQGRVDSRFLHNESFGQLCCAILRTLGGTVTLEDFRATLGQPLASWSTSDGELDEKA